MKLRISTSHQIVIGCAAALLILVLLGQIAYRTADSVGEGGDAATRVQNVLLYSDNLTAQMAEMDRELRATLEGGGLRATAAYTLARTRIVENLELLDALSDPDLPGSSHLTTIQRIADAKLSAIQRSVERFDSAGLPDQVAVGAALKASETLTAELNSEIQLMQRIELSELATQTINESASARQARNAILLVSVGAFVFLTVGAALMIGDLRNRRAGQERLRQSEERFRTLADSAPIGIFLTDRNGSLEFVNEKHTSITGLGAREARGRTWVDALHPDDRVSVSQEWQLAASRGAEFESEFRSVMPDGRIVWLHGRSAPLHDEEGSVVGFVGTVTDITARKLGEAERDRFFSLSPDLLSIVDFRGTRRRFNPACSALLGHDARALESAELLDLVHPEDRDATVAHVRRLMRGGSVTRFENRIRKRDGTYLSLSWSAASDMDHKLVYSIARDVTGIPGQERPSPRQEAPEGAAATREAAGRERVLIIAETELGRSLSGLLEQRSVDTACSTSGQAGMERAASESFDGIILQLHLPDMDGRDLLSAIRKRDSTRATPVLAVTTSEDRRTIAGLRIQGFVEEPVRMDQILDSLRRAGLPAGKRRHQKREETTAV